MNKITLLIIALALPFFNHAQLVSSSSSNTLSHHVLFDSDSRIVNESEALALLEVLEIVQDRVEEITLSGHTDFVGDDDYNKELSEDRVRSVKALLVENGYRINELSYRGESKPVAENSTAEGMQLNRRVEVVVRLAPEDELPHYSMEDVLELICPDEQKFCVDTRVKQNILCREGTIITLPPYCFEDYNPAQCVDVRIIEALEKEDMVLASLNTMSSDKRLESGGMLKISASQDGNELNFVEGKEATLFVPAQVEAEDMQLFNATEEDMNWVLDPDQEVILLRGNVLDRYFYGGQDGFGNSRCRFFWCRVRRAFIPKKDRMEIIDGMIYYGGPGGNQAAAEALAERYGTELDDLTKILDEENKVFDELTYYLTKTERLGWINCDRFIGMQEIQNVMADTQTSQRTQTFAVFDNMNSILNGSDTDGGSWFTLPVNEEITMISIKVEDGQPMLAVADVKFNDEGLVPLKYEAVSPKEIEREIKRRVN